MIFNKFKFLLCMMIIGLIVISGCNKPSEKKLTIGMIPIKDANEMKEEFESIRLYLEEQLHMSVEVAVVDHYVELIEQMKQGNIDIGWYGAFSYIAAERELELRPLVAEERKDTGRFYQSLIITKRDSDIQSIQDLKGKQFAFVDAGSTSGFVIPYALFVSRSIDYKTFFSKIHYSNMHEQVPFDILEGTVDAGTISSIWFEQMDQENKIDKEDFKVIWKSNHIPGLLFAARSDLNEDTAEQFKQAMFSLHNTIPEQLNIFDQGIEKYVEVDDAEYNSIRNIATILGEEFIYEQFLRGK